MSFHQIYYAFGLVPIHRIITPSPLEYIVNIKEECPICFETKSNIINTICNHKFCSYCIFNWLLQHPSCPICRRFLIKL